MTEHLILSPHCDDAFLSLGGALGQMRGGVTVATIFGTCAWTARPEVYADADLSAVNRAEDRLAAEAAGCELQLYEYPEALLRGYTEWNRPELLPADTALADEIYDAVVGLITEARSIYIPIAPGSHVDHRIISGFTSRIMKLPSKNVYLYEDLPYAWYGGLYERLHVYEQSYTVEPVVYDISPTIDTKRRILECYPSQLLSADIERVFEYSRLLYGDGAKERIWKLSQK